MNANSPPAVKAEAYEAWLREKVATSLADETPPVTHDDAMTAAHHMIEKRRGDANGR